MSKPEEIAITGKNYFAWPYEEQTQIKHKVLGSYAKIWIAKLGSRSNTLFFDCHGGCGAYITQDGCVHYGSSILVKSIADEVNKGRQFKTGVYYCEIKREYYDNYKEVLKDIGIPKIICFNSSFESVINSARVSKYYNTFPTLFLVDPFGYNFEIKYLSELMRSFGNEIIVNFMFDFINRFISMPHLEEQFNCFFGSDEWKKAIPLKGNQREAVLVNVFKKKLKELTGAKFVFAYRLCYPYKDQTYYYLIHATNHIDGITLMKDAFAGINNGRVEYLGNNNDAISLFDLSSYKADDIYDSFLAKHKANKLSFRSFWLEIVEATAYTSKDLSEALKKLEAEGKVIVTRVSSKRGAYKEADTIYVV